jgi:von Willebrand factor A domain-containing protein 7
MRSTSSPRLARTAFAVAAGLASIGIAGSATAVIPQRAFGPGHCGPVDPAYAEGANATGGQLFLMSPSEMPAGELISATVENAPVLLRATGTAAGTASALSLPVDASTRRLVISAMFDNTGGALDVRAPDGAAVAANDRVVDTQLNCGRIISIDRPDAGVWRANVSPTGQFWLVVYAVSDLDLIRPEFVGGGSPGSDGPLKIAGSPVVGRPATLRAQVTGPAMKSYEFVLLSAEGQPIKNVTLARASNGAWEGTFDLPSEPFRLAVTGEDQSGTRYQRSSRVPFHAEMVEVRPATLDASLRAGSDRRVAFTIRNAGPAARYRIEALDGQGFVTRVEPATVDLDAGAEQEAGIWLRVPAGTAAGTEIELFVIASSDGPRRTSNSAMLHLRIRE